MCDLVTLEDDLLTIRNLVLGMSMAASTLPPDLGGPIRAVANETFYRIEEARALVARCRAGGNMGRAPISHLSVIT